MTDPKLIMYLVSASNFIAFLASTMAFIQLTNASRSRQANWMAIVGLFNLGWALIILGRISQTQ